MWKLWYRTRARLSNVRLSSTTDCLAMESSIVFDWQNFIVSSIRFDWVQQSHDWSLIGFDYRTVRLDTPGNIQLLNPRWHQNFGISGTVHPQPSSQFPSRYWSRELLPLVNLFTKWTKTTRTTQWYKSVYPHVILLLSQRCLNWLQCLMCNVSVPRIAVFSNASHQVELQSRNWQVNIAAFYYYHHILVFVINNDLIMATL